MENNAPFAVTGLYYLIVPDINADVVTLIQAPAVAGEFGEGAFEM